MLETLKDLCLNNVNSEFQPSLLLLDFELGAHIAAKKILLLLKPVVSILVKHGTEKSVSLQY